MIAYYPLDDSADDLTGHGYDGIVVGSEEYTRGAVNYAIQLDGTNYVEVAQQPVYADELTVAFWVKIDDPQVEGVLVGNMSTSAKSGYFIGVKNGRLTVAAYDSAHNYFSGEGESIVPRTWTHIAITWRKSYNAVTVYMNGKGSAATFYVGPSSIEIPDNSLFFGQKPWSVFAPSLVGLLDDIRIYDRILYPEEIKGLATAFAPGPTPTPGQLVTVDDIAIRADEREPHAAGGYRMRGNVGIGGALSTGGPIRPDAVSRVIVGEDGVLSAQGNYDLVKAPYGFAIEGSTMTSDRIQLVDHPEKLNVFFFGATTVLNEIKLDKKSTGVCAWVDLSLTTPYFVSLVYSEPVDLLVPVEICPGDLATIQGLTLDIGLDDAVAVPVPASPLKVSRLGYVPREGRVELGAAAELKAFTVGAEIALKDWELPAVKVTAADLNRPIGATGLFLQYLSGSMSNLEKITDDPLSVRIAAGLGITGGPRISIFGTDLALLRVDGEIAITPSTSATLSGMAWLLEKIELARLSAEANWAQDKYTVRAWVAAPFKVVEGQIFLMIMPAISKAMSTPQSTFPISFPSSAARVSRRSKWAQTARALA
ncbi:MAG: LamG domain-containing protein [Candidatus Schekmanbacteria bacterium]|nr:LamG domain-containing protein [Candidatus Schekmanbacteria bacterium]